jgi:hypothetical protein
MLHRRILASGQGLAMSGRSNGLIWAHPSKVIGNPALESLSSEDRSAEDPVSFFFEISQTGDLMCGIVRMVVQCKRVSIWAETLRADQRARLLLRPPCKTGLRLAKSEPELVRVMPVSAYGKHASLRSRWRVASTAG